MEPLLPEELRLNRDPSTGTEMAVVPGEIRKSEVPIGTHLAPTAAELPKFLRVFEERYAPEELSKVMRIVAVATSHHRLLRTAA